jgi:hypothetical protein
MADELQNESLTPAVAPAAVPDIITTREGGDTATSSSATPAPGVLGDLNQANLQRQAAAETTQGAADLQAEADKKDADAQDFDAAQKQQQAQVAQNDLQLLQQRTDAANALKAKADIELGGSSPQFHNLLQNESTARKVATGIGLLFTGMSGNVEAQKAQMAELDNQVKNDFNVQRENYNSKLQYAKLKGEDVNDLYSQYEKYQGFSHAAEQKANEAVAAKILAEAKRNGIPVQQAMATSAYQNAVANAADHQAQSLGAYARHYQTTRQLTPTVTDVEGKVQGKGTKATAPIANVDSNDIDFLRKNPPTEKARDAARRLLTNDPGIIDKIKGVVSGGNLPDYLSRLTPDERAQAEAIVRVTPPLAEVSTNNKRAGTNKEMLVGTMESHIPSATDTPTSRKMKEANLDKATGRVGAFQQGQTPTAPQAQPMITIVNKKTGEKKQVTRAEAAKLGAIAP